MVKNKGQRKRSPEAHLPAKPPKKTGKRGVGPLNEKEDFENPVKKDGKTAAAEPQQPELLETPAPPPAPVVVKGRFAATVLPPIYSSAPKTAQKLISFRLTLDLLKEHEGLFPKIVEEAWTWVKKPNRPKTSIGLPGQTARFYLSHDIKEEEIILPVAKVTNATVAIIQKKGDGRALKVTRFSFRLQVPWSAEVSKFADSHYDMTLWFEMKTTQERLFDEEEGDDNE